MDRRYFVQSLAIAGGLFTVSRISTGCKTSTDPVSAEGFGADVDIVRAGAEFEAVGIKTYEVAAASGLLTDQAVIDTAVAFMQDHIAHLDALNNLLTSFDYDEIDPTNASPDPGVATVANQTDILKLALGVEFQAASFYFSGAVLELKTTEARRVFCNILPVETAHFITYKSVLGLTPVIDAAIFEDMTSGLV